MTASVRLVPLRSFVLNLSQPRQHERQFPLNTTSGSTDEARRAGSRQARSATIASRTATPANVGEIRRLGVEEQRANGVGQRHGGDAAEHEAEDDQAQTLREDQLQHRRARGAERHADAELLRSLVDGEGDHAGKAGGGDEERDAGKDADERGRQPRRRERRRAHLVERPELIDRLVRIDRVHRVAHLLDERLPDRRMSAPGT